MALTGKLVVGGLVAVAFVSVVFGATRCQANERANAAAGPESAWWIDAPAGPTLVVSDRLDRSRNTGHRLVAIDAATGKRIATRVLELRGADCSPALGGRLWCLFSSRVELVDARTLATVSVIDSDLRAAGLPTAVRLQVTPEAAYAVVSDGRIARIDAGSRAVSIVPASPTDAAWLSLSLPQRSSCALADESHRPAKTTLLEPQFLAVGKVILAEHVSSLDAATARTKLARLDANGQPAWNVEIGGRCQFAYEHAGSVVIATRDGRHRAHAIDLATGTLRWTLAFD